MKLKHKRGIMGELMSEFLIEHGGTNLPAESNLLAELFGFANDGYDRWESPEGELHLSLESAHNAQTGSK